MIHKTNPSPLALSAFALDYPVHGAAAQGDLVRLTALLEARPERVHEQNDLQRIPLHEACSENQLETVKVLLPVSKLNHQDRKGFTPLMHAAWKGHTRIVEALLAAGANTELSDFRQETALHLCLGWARLDCFQLLLRCSNPHQANREGFTVATLIELEGSPEFKDIFEQIEGLKRTEAEAKDLLQSLNAAAGPCANSTWDCTPPEPLEAPKRMRL